MNEGDEMLFVTPSGGGYGDPLERDPALVLEDVAARADHRGDRARRLRRGARRRRQWPSTRRRRRRAADAAEGGAR